MNDTVIREDRNGVAVLTLNRPAQLNALDPAMAAALHRQTAAVAADASVRCVVIGGSGGNFMAGGDIGYFKQFLELDEAQRDHDLRAVIRDVHAAIELIVTMRKPVIAMVGGAVAGFGLSLMAACDLAIAAQESYFTLAYRHIGASPDGGATWTLPRIVGRKQAMEMALLGNRFDGQRALQFGLVNQVVAAESLEESVMKLAAILVRGPALAMAQAKSLINASSTNRLQEHLHLEMESFAKCAASGEFAEGVTAFLEKRSPQFI